VLSTGCGDEPVQVPLSGSKVRVPDGVVPPELGGLSAGEEDVSGPLKEAGDRAYVSDVRFYSLREGDRLRATVEVARFTPDAQTSDADFQLKVAAQLGAPRTRRMGTDTVYVSSGNRQTYYMWFRGLHMVLVGVPAEGTAGRTLVREALERVRP